MKIRIDDLSGPAVQSLLEFHLRSMHENSPPGAIFALDLSGLKQCGVTVWSAWDDETLLGVGALKELGSTSGEIKSMRTHSSHLRRGVAIKLLEHMIGIARERGYDRLSLETGSGPAFEPALALYRNRGFTDGPAFSDYEKSPFNQFLHLSL